jgi:hypothetical protein
MPPSTSESYTGVAGTPADDAPTPKALVSRADARLLAAKRAGRARCIGPELSALPESCARAAEA